MDACGSACDKANATVTVFGQHCPAMCAADVPITLIQTHTRAAHIMLVTHVLQDSPKQGATAAASSPQAVCHSAAVPPTGHGGRHLTLLCTCCQLATTSAWKQCHCFAQARRCSDVEAHPLTCCREPPEMLSGTARDCCCMLYAAAVCLQYRASSFSASL